MKELADALEALYRVLGPAAVTAIGGLLIKLWKLHRADLRELEKRIQVKLDEETRLRNEYTKLRAEGSAERFRIVGERLADLRDDIQAVRDTVERRRDHGRSRGAE